MRLTGQGYNSGKFPDLTFPILPVWLCPTWCLHLVACSFRPRYLRRPLRPTAHAFSPRLSGCSHPSSPSLAIFGAVFSLCLTALCFPPGVFRVPICPFPSASRWSVPGAVVLCQAHPLTALHAPLACVSLWGGACAPDAPAWVCPAKHGMVSPLLTLSQGLSRRGLGHSPSPHTQRGTQFVPLSHLEAGVSALQGAGPQHGQSPCRSMGRSAGLYSAPAVFSALSWVLVSQKELPPFLWDAARRVQSLRLWRDQGAAPWRTEAVSVFFTFRLEGITWK